VQVFKNPEALPAAAQRRRPVSLATSFPGPLDLAGWQPVLSLTADRPRATGEVATGTVYAGYAPAGTLY